ncbi:MAG: hypothetical protein HPY45_09180 [Anaerolineae bacterium]|nr:hypothetical protein [Anaerolineae bacterium]
MRQPGFLFLLCITLTIIACSGSGLALSHQPSTGMDASTPTPFQPAATVPRPLPTWNGQGSDTPEGIPPEALSTSDGAYPETPEKVAQAFLIASQVAPAEMEQYLSESLKKQLNGSNPLSLLGFNAPIEGFALQTGSVSLETGSASVDFGLQIGGELTRRKFNLTFENERWVISGVEIY